MALKDYIGAAASAFGNRFNSDYGAQLISNVSNRYKQGGISAALTPQRAMASGAEGPRAVPKEDGGYDYFIGDTPVDMNTYMAWGGNVPGDEPALGGQPAGQPEPMSATGTTGSGTAQSPNWGVISGTRYDLNDPGQFQAYISAADQLLNSDFETYRSRAERLRDEDIAQAKAQEDEINYNIERAMQRLGEQEGQYNTDWGRSVADLAEGYRQGSARRQAFYASVAPRVYQSSQGTSQEYAGNKFKEGQTRYEEDKARATKGFADTRQDYAQQKQNTSNQFNLYKTQREAQTQDEIAEQARNVRNKRDEAMAGAFNYSGEMRNATGSSNKWATPSFAERNLDYSPSQVNLNDLMQFIKFQPASAGATGQVSTVRQAIATPEAGGQALGTYLGYQPEEEEGSTLNKYKTGYAY
jgi:hypothetical protein